MSVPLRTRSDLKAAGRALAIKSADAVAAHFAGLPQAEMEDEARIHAAFEGMLAEAATAGSEYLKAGIPPTWVRAFVNAFQRAAVARLALYSLAARPAANDA